MKDIISIFSSPFRMIFEDVENLFTNPPNNSIVSIIEGDPGIGKTILALKIGAKCAQTGRKVLFIPFEENINSLKSLIRSFNNEFLSLKKYYFFYDEKFSIKKIREKGIDLNKGFLAILDKPTEISDLSAKQIIKKMDDYIHDAMVQFNLGRCFDLVIFDSVNVIPRFAEKFSDDNRKESDNTSISSIFEPTFPFTRSQLNKIRDIAFINHINILFVVEGEPKTYNAEYVEYHADVLLRLTKGNNNNELRFLKTRSRPTPKGVHDFNLTNNLIEIYPSIETTYDVVRKKLNEGFESTSPQCNWDNLDIENNDVHIKGWNNEINGFLKSGDIICIEGETDSGKSDLIRVMINAVTLCEGKILRIGKSAEDPIHVCMNETDWSRNRIFFELVRNIIQHSKCSTIGIDSINSIIANHPIVIDDDNFIPVLFKLIRLLKISIIIQVNRESLLGQQCLRICDVKIAINKIPKPDGFIRLISINSPRLNDKINTKQLELSFYQQNGKLQAEISDQNLHSWHISSDLRARRIKVQLLVPSGSPSEFTHSNHLAFIAGHIVGHNNVTIRRIINKSERMISIDKREYPSDIDRNTVSRIIKSNVQSNHEDLTIAVVEDHDLQVLSPDGKCQNEEILEKLEPLGKLDTWKDVLPDKRFRFVEPILHEKEIVAVPYMIDIGCLVFNREMLKKNIINILKDKDKQKKYYVTPPKELKELLDSIDDKKYFENFTGWEEVKQKSLFNFKFNYFGRETLTVMILEFLSSFLNYRPNIKSPKLPPRIHEHFQYFRELLGIPPGGGVDFKYNPRNSFFQRLWYSQLSNLDAKNYLGLKGNGFDLYTMPQTYNPTCSIGYFVIPKGSSSKYLGVDLIKEFICEELVNERMLDLVGLSPYEFHYTKDLFNKPNWLKNNLYFKSKKQFTQNCILRSNLCSEYSKKASIISSIISSILFEVHVGEIESLCDTLNKIIKGKNSKKVIINK